MRCYRLIIVLSFVCSMPGFAICLPDAEVQLLAKGYPVEAVSGLNQVTSLADAYCTQAKYIGYLQPYMGDIAGYKVGFTSIAGQQRFNILSPATGVLLQGMMLNGDAKIPLNFGYRTLIEPDFMVTIADERIMQAKNARETLSYVSSIHPFVEVVAMRLAEHEPVTGNSLVAINIAATNAVIGPAITVIDSDAFYQKIPRLIARFTDQNNNLVQETDASALMGHPMEVLFWLVQEFKSRGIALKAGQKISLGATGKLFPLASETQHYRYEFIGLTEKPVAVTVSLLQPEGQANNE